MELTGTDSWFGKLCYRKGGRPAITDGLVSLLTLSDKGSVDHDYRIPCGVVWPGLYASPLAYCLHEPRKATPTSLILVSLR